MGLLESVKLRCERNQFDEEYATICVDGQPVAWVFRTPDGRTYINGLNITATDITDRLNVSTAA